MKELLRPYYLRWLYFRFSPGARPPEFSDCWRFPSFPLRSADLAERLSLEHIPAFLFYPMGDFHARLQRTQHFAMELATRGSPCFLLNPHLGRQFQRLYRQDPEARFSLLRPQLAELHVRLPAEPVYHGRLLDTSESIKLADAFSPLFAFAGSSVIQMISLPTWMDAAEILRARFGWPIIYDCHDFISGFRGISQDILSAEDRTFAAADQVLLSSDYLLKVHSDRLSGLRAKSSILRNAADPAHFAGIAQGRRLRAGTATGIIGYFGSLDEWFDVEAMANCLRDFPNRRFQLIGRVEHQPIRELRRFPNLELAGEVSYERLPELVAGFDVGLIPFHITPLTRATNPIKLYEYLSCGLPVVSSRLPEVERFGSLVYLAESSEDFPRCLARALAETDPYQPLRRMEATRRDTWSARTTQLAESAGSSFRTPCRALVI